MTGGDYDLRVFAEGVRIPAMGVSRSQQMGQPMSFTVRLAPTKQAFRVPPKTYMQVFLLENGESRLFAEGHVQDRGIVFGRDGQRQVMLYCVSPDTIWAQARLGLNIGQQLGAPYVNLMHFFVGLSPKEDGAGPEVVPGQQAAQGLVELNLLTARGSNDTLSNYLSFYTQIVNFMQEFGPMSGLAHVIANLANYSPLYRRDYNAMQLSRRIAFAENKRIIKILSSQRLAEALFQRLQNFSSDATLLDILNVLLEDTLHAYLFIPSPMFNQENLESELEMTANTERREGLGEVRVNATAYQPTNVTPSSKCSELRNDPRIKAFLDLIARGEVSQRLDRAEQYKVIVGGSLMSSTRKHPNEKVWIPRINDYSTAAGRYQFLYDTWNSVVRLLASGEKTVLADFSAANQDTAAVYLIKEQGAVGDILSGNIDRAIFKLSRIWASLPASNGRGVYPGQENVPHNMQAMASYYTRQLQKYDSNAPVEDLGRFAVLQSQDEYEVTFGAMPQFVMVPRLHFSPPPVCNVIFPEQINTGQLRDGFMQAPSRMLMMGRPISQVMEINNNQGITAYANEIKFAPRYLQYIIDALYKDGTTNDITTTGRNEAILKARAESITATLAQRGIKIDEAVSDPALAHLVFEALGLKEASEASREDMLSAALRGEGGMPDSLLGMHTYDELFRGIVPMQGFFPFSTNTPDLNAIQAEIQASIQASLGRIMAGPDKATAFAQAMASAKKDLSIINLYASFQLALARRSVRRGSVTTTLNTNLVCGFPAAIYDRSLGWTTGEVVAVNDVVDVQGRSAMTTIELSGCVFYDDYDDPVWNRMNREMDAEACGLDLTGLPENPILFDDGFSAENIGASVYKPILGMGSVIDFAKLIGSKATNVRDSLEAIRELYQKQESPSEWVRQITRRSVANEDQVMRLLLHAEAAASGERYTGTFVADEIAVRGQPFMKERQDWAIRYVQEIESGAFALDAFQTEIE
jgi:muramidase (phage lysozyme)